MASLFCFYVGILSFHPTAYVAREELNNYISKLKAPFITGMLKNQIENQFWWRVMTKNHLKNNIFTGF